MVSEMDYSKILLIAISIISPIFNIYQFIESKSRLRIGLGRGWGINKDGIGTYLAGYVVISNVGSKPAYFSYIKIIKTDGDYYFPHNTLEPTTKIEPGQSITGHIPIGHMLNDGAKDIVVCDGVWKEYRLGTRKFRKVITDLQAEKSRLEALGHRVHPNSSGI